MPLSKAKSGLQSLSAIRRSPVSLVPRFRFRSRQSMRMQGLHRLGSFDAPPAAKPGGSVMLQDKEIIAPDTVVVVATPRQGRDVTDLCAVDRYIARLGPAYAKRTQELLASDWKSISAWCVENGLPSFPTSPETVVAYLTSHSSVYRVSTLRRRMASLSHLHSALGEANPVHSQAVRLTLRGIARTRGERPAGRRAPLRQGDIEAMIATLGTSLRDLRDRTLLQVARDSLARRAELARLEAEDIHRSEERRGGKAG